ncbi:hypothetical protein PHMEG_00010294 [Phytophthora megakarya]|uniref:Uncharacterized protein n=1 Tax=Phytophthora megakarya TaxID=4795 RepID=A0A225WF16_9STRA|nr:hypothetical protein PHMEG_00010294 [Phytophthora megakarya]
MVVMRSPTDHSVDVEDQSRIQMEFQAGGSRQLVVRASTEETRRSEMMDEIRRLNEEIQSLQEQVEVTTRSVESMERLAFHLERLTREFLQDPRERMQVREIQEDTTQSGADA